MQYDINVNIRQNGAHITWTNRYKITNQRVATPNVERSHTIVLKPMGDDLLSGDRDRISLKSMRRIRAFAATILDTSGYPYSKNQRRWESEFESGVVFNGINAHLFDDLVDTILKAIQGSYELYAHKDKANAKLNLKAAVCRAHELFTNDEVEALVKEALIEHVLKL